MPSAQHSKKFTPFDKQTFVRFSLGLFIFVGFMSTMYLVTGNQDVRNQAMTQNGSVEVRTSVQPSNLTVGQSGKITLAINTHGMPITGFQTILTLNSTALPPLTTNNVLIVPNSGLTLIFSNVVPTATGQDVQIALRPSGALNSTLAFTNNTFSNVVEISFTAQRAGIVDAFFDPELTYALDQNSDDALSPIDPFTINIADRAVTPTKTPSHNNPTPTKGAATPFPTKVVTTPRPTPKVSTTPSNNRRRSWFWGRSYRRHINRFPWFKKD